MVEEGADLIDIGGESTRPRHRRVLPAVDEIRRVVPVIEALKKRVKVPIAVDTYKALVAEAAVAAGAEIINDIGGFRLDPQLPGLAAREKIGVILMHSRGKGNRPAFPAVSQEHHSHCDRKSGKVDKKSHPCWGSATTINCGSWFGFWKAGRRKLDSVEEPGSFSIVRAAAARRGFEEVIYRGTAEGACRRTLGGKSGLCRDCDPCRSPHPAGPRRERNGAGGQSV